MPALDFFFRYFQLRLLKLHQLQKVLCGYGFLLKRKLGKTQFHLIPFKAVTYVILIYLINFRFLKIQDLLKYIMDIMNMEQRNILVLMYIPNRINEILIYVII